MGIELTNWELYETHYGNTTDQMEIKPTHCGNRITNWELYETHYGNTTDQMEIKPNPWWE